MERPETISRNRPVGYIIAIGAVIVFVLIVLGAIGTFVRLSWIRSEDGRYSAVLEHMKSTNPLVRQFETRFNGAEHLISYFDGTYGTPTWMSEFVTSDRLRIAMQFPIKIEGSTAIATGKATFWVMEIVAIEKTYPPSQEVEHYSDFAATFGEEKWKQFFESDMDLREFVESLRE